MSTFLNNWFLLFINEQNIMTCFSSDCFNYIDKRSTSRRKSYDDEENSQNRSFRCEFESLKSFQSFSADNVIWDAFYRRDRSESRSKRARRTRILNFFFFQRFMRKRFIFLFLWLLKRVASWSNRTELAQNAKRIIIDDVCLSINCDAIHSCFSSLEMSLCIRDFSKSLLSLLVLDLHSLRMMFDMFAIRMRYLIWICNWFRCKSMKTTCVSTFKIEIEMIRNDSKMFRKQRLYKIASLLIILDLLFLSMCQKKTS
jgi:hypothetical protein